MEAVETENKLKEQLIFLIDKLSTTSLSENEFTKLLQNKNLVLQYAQNKANKIRQENFSNKIYIRALIEISNYCKNACFYCGINCKNQNIKRYRLSEEEILDCCKIAYELGFRTFVLQGGEDAFFTDEKICNILKSIKSTYPDCAITLSLGEKSKESYELLKNSGADRYLLREETANPVHYKKLHPENMNHKNRLDCLKNLKELGFQTGAGFMVGSPFQTLEDIAKDLFFIQELKPQMVGIGPFIPHSQTEFANFPQGDLDLTLFILSLLRIMNPKVLLPATTALSTINPEGRILGILSGANVVMPNVSPMEQRKNYSLYNNKASVNEESAEGLTLLQKQLDKINCKIDFSRGDYQN
ncbi:MAG: [FeFe] hydrogenase H-cluster radical SAM maturase HydE [Treponemataceae bacterium]|nr:[FeFe] hydrogenase H-cluster radical SAM maturase HydE [Treponemataceae bacterium]